MDATRYLDGNLAPVTQETTAVDLEVIGTIPAELDGRYLRNGPNPRDAIDEAKHHWFTGDGMVHGIRLRDGRAEWYRSRFVRSPEVATALGEEPNRGPFPEDRQIFAANTNVVGLAGRTYALVEAGSPPIELSPELDTVAPSDFGGTLPYGFTAHPKVDPVTGDLHAAAYWWGFGNVVQYLIVGPDGRVRYHQDIPTPGEGSPMMHDMAITASRAVLFDLPCIFDMDAAVAGYALPYRWHPDNGSRVGVLPKEGGEVTWLDVEPCYVYHPLNAYDTSDGKVVVDLVRHPRMFDHDVNGPNEGIPTLDRWTIDLAAGKVVEERLDDRPQEFPRVDERLVGRPHRYGYAVNIGSAWDHGGLIRHDAQTGTSVLRSYGPDRGTMEAVFVPRTPSSAEDDGWVVSIVHDATTERAELVIVNAGDFTGEPQARVLIPARIPYGFHGNWVPTGS